jgi:hypothetical protein
MSAIATILSGVPRIILLGGAIALLVAAGAFTLGFKLPKSAAAQHHAALAVSAQPVDSAIVHAHLQRFLDEMPRP